MQTRHPRLPVIRPSPFDIARRRLSAQVQEELGTEWARIRGIGGLALPRPVK